MERKREDWTAILKLLSVDDLSQLSEAIEAKGPSTDVLFFLDYFNNMNRSPEDHVVHMLSTNGYNVLKINLQNS